MSEPTSPNQLEFIPHPPPLRLRGEVVLSEAKQEWQKTKQPVLLLDLNQIRTEHQRQWQEYQDQQQRLLLVAKQPEIPVVEQAQPTEAATSDELKSKPDSFSSIKPKFTFTWPEISRPRLPQVNFKWPRLPDLPALPSWELKLLHLPTLSPQRIINFFGNFFLGGAIALLLLFGTPIVILETQPLISKAMESLNKMPWQSDKPVVIPPLASPSPTPEPTITSQEDVFSINIPDLDINSVVVPNVDPTDPTHYTTALKQGIAHAQGTGLPEQFEFSKTIYLFAHSTDAPWNILRYNAQFYALKDAELGQKIELTFWGDTYTYIIENKQIVEANDTSALQPQQDREQLILQTCYPPGTTNKRLLITATPSASLDK